MKRSVLYFSDLVKVDFRVKTVIPDDDWLFELSLWTNLRSSVSQAGPERRLSVPGGFGSAAGGGGARWGGVGSAGGRQRRGASESWRPFLWGDERSVVGSPEFGLHAGLWVPREPAAGWRNAAQPEPTLPGAPAHAGAGQRGEQTANTQVFIWRCLQYEYYSQALKCQRSTGQTDAFAAPAANVFIIFDSG